MYSDVQAIKSKADVLKNIQCCVNIPWNSYISNYISDELYIAALNNIYLRTYSKVISQTILLNKLVI